MKGLTKWILIAVTLIFCTQAVSAFSVSQISVDPSGSLVPNTPVIVTFKVDFASSGDETFPSSNELQMITDLDKPKWSYSIVLDGIDTAQSPTTGRILSVSGWILSYPSDKEESLKVTLEGVTPSVTQTTNKTMIKVQELDSRGNIITSSVVERTTSIIDITYVPKLAAEKEAALSTFRSHIDEKSAMGVDTATAEGKYSEAQQKINTAKSRAQTQYLQAVTDLNGAQTAMDDGEVALDRAWAESEVANANIPIMNVDNIIMWFRTNTSTKDDNQLPAIITKREVAVSYISSATDMINSGEYAEARAKAQEAFNKGNESYTDALKRQHEIETGGIIPDLSKILKIPSGLNKLILPIVVVVIIVLAVVGFVIYRKRSRWDELG